MSGAEIHRVAEKDTPVPQLPEKIKQFIEKTPWTFAKTYAKTWPHEYIVQEKIDNELFLQLANLIEKYGYVSHFYKTTVTYYDYNGRTYWHMGNIINRCDERDTYHRREKDGRLPRPWFNMDRYEIVVPRSNGEAVFWPCGQKSAFGAQIMMLHKTGNNNCRQAGIMLDVHHLR